MVNGLPRRKGPMPDVNKDGSPRARPGKLPDPEAAKSARLIMRMHPDLTEVLNLRAAERGMSRSKLIEQVLVGFLMADPRNPKMSPVGRIDRSQPTPLQMRESNPHRFAERWQRFVQAHQALFGMPPSTDWLDDLDAFWDPHEPDQISIDAEAEETAADNAAALKRLRAKK